MDLIKIAEEAFATGKQHPSFKAGDTVTVAYRIIEGNKERTAVSWCCYQDFRSWRQKAFHCTQNVWYRRCRTYFPNRITGYRQHRSEQGR